MKIKILSRSLFGDEKSHLFWIGRGNLFADEYVRERLIVIEKFGIGCGDE